MFRRSAIGIGGVVIAVAVSLGVPAVAQVPTEADKLNAEVIRLYQAGKFAEAVPLAQRALALRETALGLEHPSVGTSLNNLASLYKAQGRYGEAEPLYKRSLALREKALGPGHPDVGSSLNSLADLYRAQGRYGEAEPLYKRSLALREKALGPEHPSVATSLNNLAVLHQDQGRFAEAEPLYKRSLASREKALGADHLDVASTLGHLAALYQAQERFVDALPLRRRIVAIRERVQGAEHRDTAAALFTLASLYRSVDFDREAELMAKRSLAIREKIHGASHPEVAASLRLVAIMFQYQLRYDEAEPPFRRIVTIHETLSGPDHPDVASALDDLFNMLHAQSRYEDAFPIAKRGLTIREKALGADHASTATSRRNLVRAYAGLKRWREAAELRQQDLVSAEKRLGAKHPDFLAMVLGDIDFEYEQGRLVEAIEIAKRQLPIRQQQFGAESNRVAFLLRSLAHMQREAGDFDGADRSERSSLAIFEKNLPPDSRVLTRSLRRLAEQHYGQGNWAMSAEFWQRAEGIIALRNRRQASLVQRYASGAQSFERSDYWAQLPIGFVKATYELGRAAAPTATQAAATFISSQHALVSQAADALARMAARGAAGNAELAGAIRKRQDLVVEWELLDRFITAQRSREPAKRNPDTERETTKRLTAIDGTLREIDTLLEQRFPGYVALAIPEPTSIAQTQAALRADEALVLFLDTPAWKPRSEETFLWVVTKTDVRWVRSDLGTEALTREVAALRCGLDYQGGWAVENSRCKELTGVDYTAEDRDAGKPLPFDVARAHTLYTGLFGEVADMIAGKQLIVVPSGPLTQLPFHTLVTKKPKLGATASDPDIAWLARTHAITVLPAVSSLKALRRNANVSAAPDPYIGFGDPVLTGVPACGTIAVPKDCPETEMKVAAVAPAKTLTRAPLTRSGPVSRAVPTYYRNGVADVGKVRELCPLPDTLLELSCVASSLGASPKNIVVGAQMTEAAIKAAKLERYRIVHFATHGLLAGETAALAKVQAEPALVMSPPDTASEADDGLLTASEIAGLKLDADWVVMSACNTAGGGAREAEALSGLARAFFYAGARALLVSHWHVNSIAATLLTSRTFAEMRADPTIGRAEAFRRSMLALIADKSRPWAAHPSAWAPFVVVGEGAAVR